MIPLKVLTLVVAGQNQPSVLVLQPVEDAPAGKARIVPIWIGPTEAAQVGMALEHMKLPRPMTHDLMLDALTNLDARIDSTVIYGSKGQMFFAHLVISQDGRLITLDARPSDAVALAVRQDAPLYIEEDVLDAASFPFLFKGEQQTEEEIAEFKTFLDHISPEDFTDIDGL
ncbi:bifunctional nuclease family protein [Adlercreutzia shanghongiae]|uniref:Bifunctional nuclease family protein n=1 Tax=Adlercreutzia shanghongiae TaxID=3111773 RepID=A0ABU6IVI2_9ACTN|nr:bifunctional nuclease family protein [Adlercreutzia sp. R22]MEC4293798.1 bifunctional nuclease family protein [Adlercreutzia sp. R22]